MDVKEIARRLTEGPWRGQLDEVLDLVADDYVLHAPGALQPFRGKDGYRQFVTTYLTAFPDGTLTVDDQIAEGDLVATRWTARGTNTGELLDIAATGRQVTIEGISYARIADGMVRETRVLWDNLALMQQLAVIPETIPARTA